MSFVLAGFAMGLGQGLTDVGKMMREDAKEAIALAQEKELIDHRAAAQMRVKGAPSGRRVARRGGSKGGGGKNGAGVRNQPGSSGPLPRSFLGGTDTIGSAAQPSAVRVSSLNAAPVGRSPRLSESPNQSTTIEGGGGAVSGGGGQQTMVGGSDGDTLQGGAPPNFMRQGFGPARGAPPLGFGGVPDDVMLETVADSPYGFNSGEQAELKEWLDLDLGMPQEEIDTALTNLQNLAYPERNKRGEWEPGKRLDVYVIRALQKRGELVFGSTTDQQTGDVELTGVPIYAAEGTESARLEATIPGAGTDVEGSPQIGAAPPAPVGFGRVPSRAAPAPGPALAPRNLPTGAEQNAALSTESAADVAAIQPPAPQPAPIETAPIVASESEYRALPPNSYYRRVPGGKVYRKGAQ